MLLHLSVRDLAVIRDLRFEPGPGLNVLSGETGAGKSLLVAAIGLVLGGRADSDAVRTGADRAVVEALFDLSNAAPARARLVEAGLDDCDELLVRRVVARSGRSGVFVNGSPATVALLRSFASCLVELTAQHESISLLGDAGCLTALDTYGCHGEPLARMEAAWRRWTGARDALDALRTAARDRAVRLDYLRYQLGELEALAPEAGEDDALRLERERLRHASRLAEGASRAEEALYSGEDSAFGQAGRAAASLRELARIDPELAPVADGLDSAAALIEGAGYTLARYADRVEVDPARLAVVEDRLAALEQALGRHGCGSAAELLAAREALSDELGALESADVRAAGLRAEEAEARGAVQAAAAKLTEARRRAAASLGDRVREEVRALGMPKATFDVGLEPIEAGPGGADRAVFRLGPNPGEAALPLARIASGGELSRTLLAVKTALAQADPVPVQVFDEVDAGIGGTVAEAVGRRLRALAADHQVLVLTHQPQVAARAHRHLRLAKTERDGRTETSLIDLDRDGRIEELARMLGGSRPAARRLATELLDEGEGEGA